MRGPSGRTRPPRPRPARLPRLTLERAACVLDHVTIRVADYRRGKAFYEAALAPLGYALAMERASGARFRKGVIPSFWVKQGEPASAGARATPDESAGCGGPFVHVAFVRESRAAVDAFHRAAAAVSTACASCR